MGRIRAHVFVSGTVQGVYYRANTRDQARERGIDGWVQNLEDGRVEAVFEGAEADVESMIEWCHEGSPRAEVADVEVGESMIEWCHEGSPRAEVADVEVEYESHKGLDGFEIRR